MIKNKKEMLVHFIGVGGVSMSALAKYCLSSGFSVSGSDRTSNERLLELEKLGAKIFVGHSENNLDGVHVVVFSDAIDENNPELKRAKELGCYVLSRAELLNMIAENFGTVIGVAGCHGKTTVTSMLAHIFIKANVPFTAHVGGEDSVYGNFINRGHEVFLSEVCEFKKNLNRFTADIAVCLNTGKDHMDCYESEEELKNTYLDFIKRGYKSIIGVNDDVLNEYKGANKIGFSIYNESKFTAKNLKEERGVYSFDLFIKGKKITKIKLNVYGEHNVKNALASIACAYEVGIPIRKIKAGLKSFKGVKRRYEQIGKINGCDVIADYAHHPTEISACLKLAEERCKGQLFVVFQPHTYSRTVFLKEEFIEVLNKVNNLSLFKTYSARENYMAGGGAKDLSDLLTSSAYFEDEKELVETLKKKVRKNDLVLILGAGDLYDKIKAILSR